MASFAFFIGMILAIWYQIIYNVPYEKQALYELSNIDTHINNNKIADMFKCRWNINAIWLSLNESFTKFTWIY
jgi:hypothetical protein